MCSYFVLLRFSKQIPVQFHTYHKHSTCPTNHIIIQVIILAVFAKEYETRISSMCCSFSVILFLRLSQFQIFSPTFLLNILQWKMELQPLQYLGYWLKSLTGTSDLFRLQNIQIGSLAHQFPFKDTENSSLGDNAAKAWGWPLSFL